MTRYAIKIEYDGTNYAGFQIQENVKTIQGCIESALFQLTREHSEVYASGRTDAGVHALGMVAHLDLKNEFDPYKLIHGLNFYLKQEKIVILNATKVPDDFHARFSAIQRRYIYKVLSRPIRPAILTDLVYWTYYKLDINKMKEASKYLIGKHDFSSFRATNCQAKSPIKTLDEILISAYNDEIHFEFAAKSFLYHQVRNLMGTLLEVGKGKLSPEDVKIILDKCDRTQAPSTAPANGLYFKSVNYEYDIWATNTDSNSQL